MQKGSKNFDDIFKNKLKGLSADSNPSDWIMMERLLEMEGLTQDNEATDESRFDEVALDKLNGIPTAEFTPDWDRMSSLLDQMNEEPSMEPSEFDQAIDNQIKHTVIPLDMGTWDRMEPILDRDRAAIVQDLDEVAKGKLTSISEVEPAWGSMNSKINRELFLPESIVKYKIIEVALILLFAFSVAQFPVKEVAEKIASSTIQIEQNKANPQTESTPAEPLDESSKLSSPVLSSDSATKEVARIAPSAKNSEDEVLASTLSTSSTDIIENENKTSESINMTDESIWDLPPTIVDALDQFASTPTFRFTSEAYNYIFQPSNVTGFDRSLAFLDLYDQQLVENVFGKRATRVGFGDQIKRNNSNQDLAMLQGVEMPTLSESPMPNPGVNVAAADSYANNKGLILSVFTGSDYNEIITPFDPVYAKEGTQQWNVGYAGGLALGMRFKNWELETGAIYASNQYSPRKLYEINSGSISTGYIASTLRDIELEVVKIPLNFRFNVNLWDKWKVYALSGATMNMVVQSEFITDDVFFKGSSFTSSSSVVSQSSKLARKDFGEGILEGGSFKDNSFFTANLGFGVERTLNKKWSVFAQPTYQRQIFSSGIGPNQDRYNAISLFLGTRVALSKKAKK